MLKHDLEASCGPRPPGGGIAARAFYETDPTDAEWTIIAPRLPDPALCGQSAEVEIVRPGVPLRSGHLNDKIWRRDVLSRIDFSLPCV